MTQEEYTQAMELAKRWKDVQTDESHGVQGKNLGMLARALLHVDDCYQHIRRSYEGD